MLKGIVLMRSAVAHLAVARFALQRLAHGPPDFREIRKSPARCQEALGLVARETDLPDGVFHVSEIGIRMCLRP